MKTDRDIRKGLRIAELKKALEDRRVALAIAVQVKIRDARTDPRDGEVRDLGESSDLNVQEEIGFALIEMKRDMLNKIDAAIGRLDNGVYGDCFDCGEEIAEARLKALPFAVRCRDCEASRERTEQHDRHASRSASSSSLPHAPN